MVLRVYVERKPGFDGAAQRLADELRDLLGVEGLEGLRLINRYDVEGLSEELFEACIPMVFSEPQSDIASRSFPLAAGAATGEGTVAGEAADGGAAAGASSVLSASSTTPTTTVVFAVEYLPGQFDQRAESASECIQLISKGERPLVRSATVYVLEGELSEADTASIKHYVINPVEAREAALELPQTLAIAAPQPQPVEVLEGFLELDQVGLAQFIDERGLAMDLADASFCQDYFAGEGRCPTITEIRMIDTYWSDHCRHTTFGTELSFRAIDDPDVQRAYERYLELRRELGREDRPQCLMDMGTIGAKYLKARGILTRLDESDEINACTVKCTVDVNGRDEDWLYLFKNETHNHPTEIEPFGGAATCVGGAIRDPLSGRSYVYQAMRVTGAADPTVPVSETLPGKLPQRKIVTEAAAGYSSYGNQIGLATGQVSELYHPGYVAKRMEIGAVLGATPADHVRREEPSVGDVIVLLGGRTGRDGIGGATGSSKTQNVESIETSGAEVQKGNAPVERKIQRLFRRGEACRLIKRCNDFGAGGVSVAVGELAEGLYIYLDRVPKKYEGLDGTELAISESQERMAVALAAEDVDAFIGYAHEENLEATPIAEVTDDARVRMEWNGDVIVDISRDFLASNGAPKHQEVQVAPGGSYDHSWEGATLAERMQALLSDLNVASNKGLAERFDSTIGAATVLMPFGGSRQLTAPMAMVAKLPVVGETTTCSGMAWGFNPYLSSSNQFAGAYLVVVESVARLIAAGFSRTDTYLSLQEYFEKLRDDPLRWGKPVASVLGALIAQIDLGVGAIGGKDSMSGSFEELDVPPTLVSFATAIASVERITSPEFKAAGHRVLRIAPQSRTAAAGQECVAVAGQEHVAAAGQEHDAASREAACCEAASREGACADLLPEAAALVATLDTIEELIASGAACAVATPGYGATAEALFKMCVGNGIGLRLTWPTDCEELFAPAYGSFLVELAEGAALPESPAGVTIAEIGATTEDYIFEACGERLNLADLQELWEAAFESVFPYRSPQGERAAAAQIEAVSYSDGPTRVHASASLARPRVIIPVFPGTNCEYDTARAFERAGALPSTLVINNLSPQAVLESSAAFAQAIRQSQIIMIPGGFSGGDEPDGSAKLIAAFFRSPEVADAVRDLLFHRDGLMLGICNGFQALVKLGLVPFGDIRPMDESCPTLTFNTIGRHQSCLVRTRVASNLSPWLSRCELDELHTIAISHGEGRFVASEEMLTQLCASGQIATQYVDECGCPSMDLAANPNGSMLAIEGVTSADGRILGKMGHSERAGAGLYKNVPGNCYQPLFEGGVGYFT